jgi:Tfp pilus assembly protein PilN
MTTPNLASRPFLNTRPVWLLTVAAGGLALALTVVNVHLWAASNRALTVQLEHRDQFLAEHRELESKLRRDAATLERVPWRSLSRRVGDLNLVLREHAFSWARLLDDVERVIPREVRVTRIAPTVGKEGYELSLDGVARSQDDILQFIDNLIVDPAFDEPKPRSVTMPDKSPSASYQFTLVVRYLPEEKPEGKTEEKTEESAELKPEVSSEVKPEVSSEVKPEEETGAKPEVKPRGKRP